MMNKKEFVEVIRERISDYLPEYITSNRNVNVVTVLTHNDCKKTGIAIIGNDELMGGPNYYLDGAYEDYLEYGDMEGVMRDIAKEIVATWRLGVPPEVKSLDYETMKDKIIFCVVDKEKNKNVLKDCPHTVDDSGLAFIYAIRIQNTGRLVINNVLASEEGYSGLDLHEIAKGNMQKMQEPTLISISNAISAIKNNDTIRDNLLVSENPVTDDIMYLLSNKDCFFGASALFYDGIKEKIAEIFDMDFYAIGSSVHEWIIIPDRGGYDISLLIETLRTQNQLMYTQEVLTDDVYRYSRDTNVLVKVTAA